MSRMRIATVVAALGVLGASGAGAGAAETERTVPLARTVMGRAQALPAQPSQVNFESASSTALGTTTRASVATGGTQANGDSHDAAISADGRYVAFPSFATNLVAGDTNGSADVFVRDRATGATTRISVATGGTQANNHSYDATISADGRYVAFISFATNLVAGDTNGHDDVFVRDRATGATTRVSVATGGAQANTWSYGPAISGDGRYVAFVSEATNLVAGDTNGTWDVFLRDQVLGTTTRVNLATGGTQADKQSESPSITHDGRYVAFVSMAANLVAGDTNGTWDVFLRDQVLGTTTRVNLATDATQADQGGDSPTVSGDGRYVAFASSATNLVIGDTNEERDAFVRDLATGTTTRVSVATNGTQSSSDNGEGVTRIAISANGRYVSFDSLGETLVEGDTNRERDVFVHDSATGTTTRVSVASSGAQAPWSSDLGAVSADGRYVAFHSQSSNLVPEDTNGALDVFVHDQTPLADFPDGITRLAGASRYETAIAVSKRYAPSVPAVYVATGTGFPDALSAAAAAANIGGPLLLTTPTALPSAVKTEIQRLNPARIYVIGGTGAVSTGVATTLASIAPVTRYGGASRYDTGRAIVNGTFAFASTAMLATGRSFPDALAATGAAGKLHAPVILVDGTKPTVSSATLSALKRMGVTNIAVAGGSGVVSSGIVTQLKNAGYTVTRFGGTDRYATTALINNAFFPGGSTDTMFLATGTDFPDALAGAALAGRMGAPLYITATTCAPTPIHDSVDALAPSKKAVLGGTSVVSDNAANNLQCTTGTH